MKDVGVPIGALFRMQRMEVFREIRKVYFGNSEVLQGMFGHSGPMWGREYVFWHNGKPLTLIHEVFSPTLDHYLGNSQPSRGILVDKCTCQDASGRLTVWHGHL
jgi:chorismate lyase